MDREPNAIPPRRGTASESNAIPPRRGDRASAILARIMQQSANPTVPSPARTSAGSHGGANYRGVALISGAHLYSHLYILLLPPLFPLIKADLGVSYTELGFAITAFSLVTGLTQTPVGFLVDRVGARALLITALALESVALMTVGLLPSYSVLVAMMMVAGLANAVYHPADYAILGASVPEGQMGRAFSVHTAAGLFGGFLAPAVAIPLAKVVGWELAVVGCAATGLLMAGVVFFGRRALYHTPRARADSGAPAGAGVGLLLSAPVLMALTFYVGLSTFGHGVSDFSVAALGQLHPAELTVAGMVLGAWLLANPIGVLAGGWIADSIRRHDLFAGACLAGIGTLLCGVGLLALPIGAVAAVFFAAGLLSGAVSPSRDMLIRAMTPAGQSGKVFGFVSTGFNIGGIVAPPVFGYVLDQGSASMVFVLAGLVSLATVPTVLMTAAQGRRAPAPA